jgi:hypothetical protein
MKKEKSIFKTKGILPTNILHINPSEKGTVIWYTKAQQRQLYFVDGLGIPKWKSTSTANALDSKQKQPCSFCPCQAIEDLPKKRFCIMPLFSISTKKAMYVWVL